MSGACHCGAVQFTVTLIDGLATARRCDCSFCAMRGAVAVSARRNDLTVTRGEDALTRYTFNTDTAQHFFCKHCGIYTHHRRRSNPDELGVNLACLKDQTPFLPVVQVRDGRNHPTDTSGARLAGVLRFTNAGDAR
ncbi:GFA family protein [Jannaschia donghaensis]|nr:GFA family protein [Jannaschia donghaensis]